MAAYILAPGAVAFLLRRQAARDSRRAGRDPRAHRRRRDHAGRCPVRRSRRDRHGDRERSGDQGEAISIVVVSEPAEAEQQVYTLFAYLWVGPTPDIFVGVQAWFASPVEAELAEEALDQLLWHR